MGIYSEKQREQISIEALNRMFRIATQGRVQSYISDNDKEPMWDGHIYVYKEQGSESKSDFLFRIPVQVKSKLVSKFDNQFVSYPIEKVCLESYLNDGGVIYFVVEIVVDEYGDYETKIFYKLLVPSVLKDTLDTIDEGGKSKNVHIDKVLSPKDKFLKVCFHFDNVRKIEGIDLINNRIPMEKVLGKEIKINTINGLNDLFNGEYCSYYVDENNIKIPVKLPVDFIEFTVHTDNVINIDENRYFSNCKRHINNKGEKFVTFGDVIKISNTKQITIMSSQENIYERHKTIEYFLNVILEQNIIHEGKEKEKIQILKNEKSFIEEVFRICDRFNIDRTLLKLKNFKDEDFNAVSFLSKVKEYSGGINNVKEIGCTIVKLLNYKIALLKMIYNDESIAYYDFYSEKINICIVNKYEGREANLSRFAIVDEELLVADNFNEEVIKKSLLPIKKENADIISGNYNILMLALIKAWDLDHKDEYINLIKHLEQIIHGHIEEDIELINKAQVEYRLNNKKLSHRILDKLYKIKFRENTKDNIKCAISILLEDYEAFEEYFSLLSKEEMEAFQNYPIYTLYKEKK